MSQKVVGLEAEDHHTAGYELELEDYGSLDEDHELLELLPVGDGGAVPWREEDADTSEAPTPDALQARVAEVIASGVRDENKLTDVAFTITHPDIGSRKLKPDDERDKPLIQDWLEDPRRARPACPAEEVVPSSVELRWRPLCSLGRVHGFILAGGADIPEVRI